MAATSFRLSGVMAAKPRFLGGVAVTRGNLRTSTLRVNRFSALASEMKNKKFVRPGAGEIKRLRSAFRAVVERDGVPATAKRFKMGLLPVACFAGGFGRPQGRTIEAVARGLARAKK